MIATALELIEKEKSELTGRLDLGKCGLAALPEALFECTWLEELIISNRWWDADKRIWIESKNSGSDNNLICISKEIRSLNNLRKLKSGGDWPRKWAITDYDFLENLTMLSSLDLSKNQITNYGFLANLTNLTSLDLRSNQITDIRFLVNLTNLSSLDLSDTQITDFCFLANLTDLCSLDLSYNQITDIRFLSNLTNLRSLDLSSNQITDISFLANLTNLSSLDLSYNQITDISILANLTNLSSLYLRSNQITNYSFLANLTNLTSLYLSYNQITEIRFLENLTNLSSLDLRTNQITEISFLANLTNITSLYLSYNQISDFSFLSNLTNLSSLDLRSNKITDIRFLSNLTSLSSLLLSSNQITDISPLLPLIMKRVQVRMEDYPSCISLFSNPLKIPPLEVVKEGNEAVVRYFSQLEKEQNKQAYLYEAKLIVIGEAGAGKTTFTRRLQKTDAEMPEREESTRGINIEKWDFPVSKVDTFHVNIWDYGGQAIYHGTHQFFFSQKSLYVLMADTREQKTDFSYWFNCVEQLAGEESLLVVLLNKREEYHWKIDENGLRGRFGEILRDIITLDLSVVNEIPALQERVRHWLVSLPSVKQPLIASWVHIREDLARETKNIISFARFREICADHNQNDYQDVRLISQYFSRIGVFTHYIDDCLLEDRIWLNSNWLCNTVYRLLENETIARLNGRLKKSDVEQVWRDNELDFEVNKLVALLGHFGLMYQVVGKDEFIIPEHLPQEQPYESWAESGVENLLHFRYRFDKFMPKGLMSRLIVALHNYIPDHTLVWNRGMNLSYGGAKAEIVETYGGANQFDIRIAGMMQRDLLIIITQAFDKLLEQFKKLNPEKGIKCPCKVCSTHQYPYFHLTDDIENALIIKAHKTNPTIECKNSFDDIAISQLLAVIDYGEVFRNIKGKTNNGVVIAKLDEIWSRIRSFRI